MTSGLSLWVVATASTDVWRSKIEAWPRQFELIRKILVLAFRSTSVRNAYTSRSQLEKKSESTSAGPLKGDPPVQVAKIKQLLLESDYPLKRIAEIAGFEHVDICPWFLNA